MLDAVVVVLFICQSYCRLDSNYGRQIHKTSTDSESREILHDWHFEILQFVRREMILELKQSAIVAPCSQGLSFLGFRVFPNNLRLRGKKWRGFRRKVFAKEMAFSAGEISEMQIADSVRSMIAHISKADTLAARRKFFANLISN
jgi:RNA-directed DNA polymerase